MLSNRVVAPRSHGITFGRSIPTEPYLRAPSPSTSRLRSASRGAPSTLLDRTRAKKTSSRSSLAGRSDCLEPSAGGREWTSTCSLVPSVCSITSANDAILDFAAVQVHADFAAQPSPRFVCPPVTPAYPNGCHHTSQYQKATLLIPCVPARSRS
jgi:hypothetical protein